MQSDISKLCADFLRSNYAAQGSDKLKATHARELTAAFFGYNSHAALLAEKSYPLHRLEEAAVLVPDIALMDRRREKLDGLPANLPRSRALAEALAEFLQGEEYFAGTVWLYDSLESYIIEVFLQENTYRIMDDLSGVMAETNATFDEIECEEANIIDHGDGITLEVTGKCIGSSDPEKPFCGDQIDIALTVELSRVAGRIAYRVPEVSTEGEVNWDWADPEGEFTPPPEGRPKEHFIAVTGGYRFGETPARFQQRQQEIGAIRKKLAFGKARAEDIDRLSELLGTDHDEFDVRDF